MVKPYSGKIQVRLTVLIAEKEIRDGRKYPYHVIYDMTGVSTSTLSDWARGRVKNISVKTLSALCKFFACKPGDLLDYVPDIDLGEKMKLKRNRSK